MDDYKSTATQYTEWAVKDALKLEVATVIRTPETVLNSTQLTKETANARENGRISSQEFIEACKADLVLYGRTPKGGKRYIVVEPKAEASRTEVETARRRAAIIEKATGTPTAAVVMAEYSTPEAEKQAAGERRPWETPSPFDKNWYGDGPDGKPKDEVFILIFRTTQG